MKLVVTEPETEALRRYLRAAGGHSLVTSALARVEVPRAVASHGRAATAKATALLATIGQLAVSLDLLDEAADLGPEVLRSLDAIHLATARRFGADLHVLVGYDRRLTEAATALGLPVAAPI